jgi:hypothetical protein
VTTRISGDARLWTGGVDSNSSTDEGGRRLPTSRLSILRSANRDASGRCQVPNGHAVTMQILQFLKNYRPDFGRIPEIQMEIALRVANRSSSLASTLLAVAFCFASHAAWATPISTTTTLTISSNSDTVASGGSVASGAQVTLIAAVKAGTVEVWPGQVNFCDASTPSCNDIHLLGTAQLFQTGPGAGTAFFTFHPGIGAHSYRAVFAGTPNGATAYAGSASRNVELIVTGTFPTKTSISGSGGVGNYSLKATVTGLVDASGLAAPSGTVSFPDTGNGNLSIASASLGAGAEAFGLANPSNTATGIFPSAVAVGDFNGDGFPDVVTADSGSNSVSILLGSGNGGFTPAANSPVAVGHDPSFVAVGDFNSDGTLDLAVANFNDGTVTILLGNGDGTFIQATNSPATVGGGPLSLAVGDFNGDGIADLAVANVKDNTVSILLGNGNGTFSGAAQSPIHVIGSSPSSVVVADFNKDGQLDIAVAIVSPNNVTVFLGNGNGTFTKAANSPVTVGLTPYSIAVGDFNGDGIPDLVTANDADVNDNPGTVTILLGSGDGGFTQASGSPVSVGVNPLIVAAGDFNADGKVDLAVTNENDNSIAILLGNVDGTFTVTPSAHVPANRFPLSVAAGDFNGDGLTDLAVSNSNLFNGSIAVFLAQITETATATATGVSVMGTGTHLVEAGYPGDSSYGSSTSATTVGLSAGPAPGFTVVATPLTVAPGKTTENSSTITVTPAGGFTGSVALSAAITSSPAGAVNLPTVSFGSTSPVSINGAAAGTAALTVSTTAATMASQVDPKRLGGVSMHAAGGVALAFIVFLCMPVRRRRWQSMLGTPLLLMAFAGGLLGCGGGGGSGTGAGGAGNPGTTAGTYTVTVTGTSGTTMATGTFTLTVQ